MFKPKKMADKKHKKKKINAKAKRKESLAKKVKK